MYVTLARGTDSVWAVLDPAVARDFAEALEIAAKKLSGKTFDEGRHLLREYGPDGTAAVAPPPVPGPAERARDQLPVDGSGDQEVDDPVDAPPEEYTIESEERIMDPEWVEAESQELIRQLAQLRQLPEGEEGVDG